MNEPLIQVQVRSQSSIRLTICKLYIESSVVQILNKAHWTWDVSVLSIGQNIYPQTMQCTADVVLGLKFFNARLIIAA